MARIGLRTGLGAGVLALAAAVGAGGAVGATTISYDPATGVLITGDAAGTGVQVELIPEAFRVSGDDIPGPSAAATVAAGPGCVKLDTGPVRCAIPADGSRFVRASLGEGDDGFRFTLFSQPTDSLVQGGSGDDLLIGGRALDRIVGGPGDDTLSPGPDPLDRPWDDVLEGGDGNDLLVDEVGAGRDTFRGDAGNDVYRALRSDPSADMVDLGTGTDTADYSARVGAVTLTVSPTGSPADDGGPGEGDDLEGVETLIGGEGPDVLTATGPSLATLAPRTVVRLRGNAGGDTLRILGALRGDLDGGIGSDTVRGGLADDRIFSREGERDTLGCGAGLDVLTSDLRDAPAPADCEILDESDRREDPNVVVTARRLAVPASGAVVVRLRCPARTVVGCRGSLRVGVARPGARLGPPTAYRLRRGQVGLVTVVRPRGQVTAARRAGARVLVRSVETGERGPKTTQRSLPTRRA